MEQLESFNQTKLDIENKIKAIFIRDKVRLVDIVTVRRLIKQWVKLTKYKSDDSNIYTDSTIDDIPKWQI